MTSPRRVQHQPAYILHHRPFRDSSQLLDVISRDHGKLALVARGSRAAKSRLRGILRPFQALRLSWFIRSDLGTLTGAEIDAAPLSLTGDALLSAYYVNELVLNFLHRHDAQPEIFDAYTRTLTALATSAELAANLRVFEIELLRLLGYALNLDHDAVAHEPLDAAEFYEYRVEQGPVPVACHRPGSVGRS
jgi:DNA repair protein RecO (recombination protein O)